MLTLNYTYAIYPTADQQAIMLEWLETCRRLYNRCLRDLKDWLNSRKCSLYSCSLDREYIMSADIPFPSYLEQKRQLTQWKKTDEKLNRVHSQVTQDVVKRLHNTWEAFKARSFGFPRFKKFGQYRSFLFPQFAENPIKKELSDRVHACPECGYSTNRDHASAQVILQRGLFNLSSTDGLSGKEIACQVVLSGVQCLDKWRFGAGKSNSQELESLHSVPR